MKSVLLSEVLNCITMKKTIVTICAFGLLVCGGQAFSQVKATPASSGTVLGGNAVTYSLPQTVLSVKVSVQHETIKRGPYARYAQKYLGSVAHLSDKEIYTILGATVSYASEADPSAVYILDNPDKSPFNLYYSTPEGFVAHDGASKPHHRSTGANREERFQLPANFDGVQIDKVSLSEPALEEAAAEAARTLFTLRKRRFDLVTGEAGENVYGAGMQAALDEMKRMEEEYIALFLGKRTVRQETKTFEVVPESGKNTSIVCRFNETAGLLPAGDLTGRPIVIELTPENKAASMAGNRAGKDSKNMVFMRVADVVRCRLVDDKTVLGEERIPIYQFGETIEVPVSALK